MFHGRLAIDRVRIEKQGRRPTSENHSHNSKKHKMITGMIHSMLHVLRHRQLLHRGDHDIAECELLPMEDNTAERQFYCIVFQLAVCFHFSHRYINSFPEEMM